ncbi:unnamed protein product [Gadus morhua 'NCC']
MPSPPLMGVGAHVRGHTGSRSAQRPEYSQHTRREGSHLPSEMVFRDPGAGRNQLFQFKEGKWSRTNNNKLKDPEWAFDHIREETRRYSNPSIIRLSQKLFYHLPTKKSFCILESSNGRHIIYFEQPKTPRLWDWAPTSDEVGPPRPWRT